MVKHPTHVYFLLIFQIVHTYVFLSNIFFFNNDVSHIQWKEYVYAPMLKLTKKEYLN